MANYRLSGYTPQASLDIPDADSLGRTFSRSTTTPFNATQWNLVRTGGANTPTITSDSPIVTVNRNDSTPSMYSGRVFLQFSIPSNLSRLDNTPQIYLYADSVIGTAKAVLTSVDTSTNAVPWDTTTPAQAVAGVQLSAGAAYLGGSSLPATISSGDNTITLNELAKYHILHGGNVASGVRYLTIAIVDYTYDWTGTLPADGVSQLISFESHGDTRPPKLILRNPWFINDRGDDFPVAGDYVIRANEVGVSQFGRSVPQLPFSQNIKGPRSLRGKNVPYKVTS